MYNGVTLPSYACVLGFCPSKKKSETNSCTGGHLTLSINYAVQRLGETGFVFCSYFVHIYIFSSRG